MSPHTYPLLLSLALLSTPTAAADRSEESEPARPSRALSDSVRQVERNTGARVIGAERIQRGGREVNRVKVVTPEGRVRVIHHDPDQSGRGRQRGQQGNRPERDD